MDSLFRISLHTLTTEGVNRARTGHDLAPCLTLIFRDAGSQLSK
jgi:hypothetical protein